MLGESRIAAIERRREAARRPQDGKPPAGRKGAFDRTKSVKSAFALLSEKVTKLCAVSGANYPIREKGKFIEADNQRYDRKRLCQP